MNLFARSSFLKGLSDNEAKEIIDEVVEMCRSESHCEARGVWREEGVRWRSGLEGARRARRDIIVSSTDPDAGD